MGRERLGVAYKKEIVRNGVNVKRFVHNFSSEASAESRKSIHSMMELPERG